MLKKANSDYLPFLDGFRAIAVGLVIVFHYWSNELKLPGGFVGVDVFFVISGFIITKSLIKECHKNTFSLKDFWIRRSKRLLPAVFAVLTVLIILSIILPIIRESAENSCYAWIAPYIPDLGGELVIIKDQIVAVIFNYTNWHFILNDVSYFDQMNRPSLLTHLWSLAIEEQFYIFWPIFISLIIARFKNSKTSVAVCVVVLLILSAAMMIVKGQASPHDARAYYGTDCRAFALLFGALLAIFWDQWNEEKFTVWHKYFFHVIGPCGLIIIGYLSCTMNGGELFAFRGGLFGAALGSVMVILAGRWNNSVTSKLMQNSVLSWIGKRSYGLYLWHWPVFILTDPAYNYPIDGWYLVALRFVLLIGAVHLSYKFIENPIRSGDMKFSYAQVTLWKCTGALTASVMLIFCSVAVVTARSDSGPYGRSVAKQHNAMTIPSESDVIPCEKPSTPPDTINTTAVHKEEINESVRDVPEKTEKSKTAESRIDVSERDLKSNSDPVLAIGDSVMLGAKVALENKIKARVDAKVGRQFTAVLEIVKSLKASKRIPSTVIIHSGTNGNIVEKQLVELMDILRSCDRVIIVNNYVPRSWQKQNNAILEKVVPAYSNAYLVNWHEACLVHKQLLYKDGIHIGNAKGAELYTSKIREALLL